LCFIAPILRSQPLGVLESGDGEVEREPELAAAGSGAAESFVDLIVVVDGSGTALAINTAQHLNAIDIHAGGIDLIFPHHENEIAQSEAATGKPFARFWVHVEYLIVEDQKMSKSLGNTYTIPDVVAKGYRPSAVRYLLLSAHYRKQLNFTWASLSQAEESLRRLTDCVARVEAVTAPGAHPALAARVAEGRQAFVEAIEDDLNTAAALGAIFELVRALNSAIDAGEIGIGDLPVIRAAFGEFDAVLGVLSLRRAEEEQPPVAVEEIERLIEERHAARRRRDFAAADRVRDDLAARGVILEDGPSGTRWKRK